MHPYNIAYVKLTRSRSDDTALNVNRRLTLTEPSPIKVILKIVSKVKIWLHYSRC